MVEFALILPVLALVFFGCIQVGLSFFSYEQVAAAANHGARAAAVNRTGDPTAAADAARSVSPTLHLTDSQIVVTYTSTNPTPGAAWSFPGTTTVSVTHPLTLSLFGLFPKVINLAATAAKRVER